MVARNEKQLAAGFCTLLFANKSAEITDLSHSVLSKSVHFASKFHLHIQQNTRILDEPVVVKETTVQYYQSTVDKTHQKISPDSDP